jgi:hypothetical protein
MSPEKSQKQVLTQMNIIITFIASWHIEMSLALPREFIRLASRS